jgi:PAS domain S-box-containing protein
MSSPIGQAGELLQEIVDNTSAVIYVKDVYGRYLLVNRQFELLFGASREEVVGKSDFDLFPPEMAEAFQANDRRAAETDQLLECEEEAPHPDGPHSYISIKFPLRDGEGRVYAVAGISTDITERIRAAREIDALRHRTELLLESVTDGICGISREGIIDFANPAAARLLDWPVEQLIGLHHNSLWPALNASPQVDPVAAVLKTGERRHVELAELRRRDGTRLPVEFIISPIWDGGKIVGAVLAFRDLREKLARQRAEQELQAASQVQRFLYPQFPPSIPGFDVAGMTFPSERVCGDYYDFQPWDGHAWCLALGDVSGHGLAPALHMVETRALLRSVLRETSDPSDVLVRMNRILGQELPEGMFVTLFVGRLDPVTRQVAYSSAGHPAGLLQSNGEILRLHSGGYPLGLFPTATYETEPVVTIEPKEILLATTDGICEMRSTKQAMFGWERQWAAVAERREEPAAEIGRALYQAARQFAQGEPQHDDVTLIVAKCLM